jgi:hypothetical protein
MWEFVHIFSHHTRVLVQALFKQPLCNVAERGQPLNMVATSLQGDHCQSHIKYDFTSPCKSDSEHSSISGFCIRWELVCPPLRCMLLHFEVIFPSILTLMMSKFYSMIVCWDFWGVGYSNTSMWHEVETTVMHDIMSVAWRIGRNRWPWRYSSADWSMR